MEHKVELARVKAIIEKIKGSSKMQKLLAEATEEQQRGTTIGDIATTTASQDLTVDSANETLAKHRRFTSMTKQPYEDTQCNDSKKQGQNSTTATRTVTSMLCDQRFPKNEVLSKNLNCKNNELFDFVITKSKIFSKQPCGFKTEK